MRKTNYNLQKIADIDNLLTLNNKNREEYISRYSNSFMIDKLIKILSNRLLIFLLISIVTIILLNITKPFKTILYASIFIFIYNSVLKIIGYLFKIPKDYYETIESFNKEREILFIKRNLYVNLYNYSKDKENSILNNIRFRINNKYFLDYNKYQNQNWLKDDLYAYVTLKEMQYKETVYTNIIRNRIELELISPNYNEEISKEKLKDILEIL